MNLRLLTVTVLLGAACPSYSYAMNESMTPNAEKLNKQQETASSAKNERELALFAAIRAGDMLKVKMLIESGANLEYEDEMGQRALDVAAAYDCDIMLYIVDKTPLPEDRGIAK